MLVVLSPDSVRSTLAAINKQTNILSAGSRSRSRAGPPAGGQSTPSASGPRTTLAGGEWAGRGGSGDVCSGRGLHNLTDMEAARRLDENIQLQPGVQYSVTVVTR